MKDEVKVFLYTTAHMSEKDGQKVYSHYLPFVAMDDGSAIKMVKQSAKNLEGKVIVEDKFLCRVASFCPDRKRPIADVTSSFEVVCPLSYIFKEKE